MYIKQTPSGGSVIWQETWLVLRYGIISWQDKIPWTERENNMRLVFLVYLCIVWFLFLSLSLFSLFFVFLSRLTLCLDTCRPPLLPRSQQALLWQLTPSGCRVAWLLPSSLRHVSYRPSLSPTTQRDRLCQPDVPHGVHLRSPFPSFLCFSWRPCSSSFALFFFSYFWPFYRCLLLQDCFCLHLMPSSDNVLCMYLHIHTQGPIKKVMLP